MFSASCTASALEINPEYLAHVHVHFEVPHDLELPTVARETFYPLEHPNYAEAASQPVLAEDQTASKAAGLEVSLFADSLSTDSAVGKIARDCTKEGMKNTAWDLWWSWVNNSTSFSARDELENTVLGCLKTYIDATPQTLTHIAATVTYYLMKGAGEVLSEEPDLAALADWLQVTNYYYVAQ